MDEKKLQELNDLAMKLRENIEQLLNLKRIILNEKVDISSAFAIKITINEDNIKELTTKSNVYEKEIVEICGLIIDKIK